MTRIDRLYFLQYLKVGGLLSHFSACMVIFLCANLRAKGFLYSVGVTGGDIVVGVASYIGREHNIMIPSLEQRSWRPHLS